MALSAIGRKVLLKHGDQRRIARQLGVEEGRVSSVVLGTELPLTEAGWKAYERIQKAVAKRLGLTLQETFQPHELRQVAETAA